MPTPSISVWFVVLITTTAPYLSGSPAARALRVPCAGGRYDGLVEQLGGRATPAVGFAMGLERLVLLVQAVNPEFNADPVVDIYGRFRGGHAVGSNDACRTSAR